jgi:hypothetical protein
MLIDDDVKVVLQGGWESALLAQKAPAYARGCENEKSIVCVQDDQKRMRPSTPIRSTS